MEYLTKSVKLFFKSPTLFLPIIFSIFSIVPVFLFLLLATMAIQGFQGEFVGAGLVLAAFSLLFLVALLGYAFFIFALALAGANIASKEGKVTLIPLFKEMRLFFWRAVRYWILFTIFWIPGILLLGAGYNQPSTVLSVLGVLWTVLLLILFLWVPPVLTKQKKVVAALKKSYKLLQKHKRSSLITIAAFVLVFALFPNALGALLTYLQKEQSIRTYVTSYFFQVFISSTATQIGLIYIFLRHNTLKQAAKHRHKQKN